MTSSSPNSFVLIIFYLIISTLTSTSLYLYNPLTSFLTPQLHSFSTLTLSFVLIIFILVSSYPIASTLQQLSFYHLVSFNLEIIQQLQCQQQAFLTHQISINYHKLHRCLLLHSHQSILHLNLYCYHFSHLSFFLISYCSYHQLLLQSLNCYTMNHSLTYSMLGLLSYLAILSYCLKLIVNHSKTQSNCCYPFQKKNYAFIVSIYYHSYLAQTKISTLKCLIYYSTQAILMIYSHCFLYFLLLIHPRLLPQ